MAIIPSFLLTVSTTINCFVASLTHVGGSLLTSGIRTFLNRWRFWDNIIRRRPPENKVRIGFGTVLDRLKIMKQIRGFSTEVGFWDRFYQNRDRIENRPIPNSKSVPKTQIVLKTQTAWDRFWLWNRSVLDPVSEEIYNGFGADFENDSSFWACFRFWVSFWLRLRFWDRTGLLPDV